MSSPPMHPSASLSATKAGVGSSKSDGYPVGETVSRNAAAKRVNDLVQLVYVSRSVGRLDGFSIQQIIATSRRHNWRAGVTGCLLFTGTGFVQALEGRADVVRNLFDLIAEDKRHVEIRSVLHVPISNRAFPDWAMGSIFDPELAADIDNILSTIDVSPINVAKIVNRMVAESFLGTR